MSNKLTPKQDLFLRYYLVSFNAADAARKAGYSPKTAGKIGQENLTKPAIREKIENSLAERRKRIGITSNRVLDELAKIAFHDMRDAMSWDNNGVAFKPSDEIDDNTAGAIQSVQESETTQSKKRSIKMHDKVKALELLSRHLGILDGPVSNSDEGDRRSTLTEVLQSLKDVYGCKD